MGKDSRKKQTAVNAAYTTTQSERSENPWINIPGGIPISYEQNGKVMKMRILTNATGGFPEPGHEEYYTVPGGANVPFHPENIRADFPAILLDEEFDALLVEQEAGQLIAPIALGGLDAAREHQSYIDLLKSASIVLISFPATAAGQEATDWWLQYLPNAKVWAIPAPYANLGHMNNTKGINIVHWIKDGLG